MTKPDSCAIAVVLDRSGSMASIRQATIDGFNEFLAAQKAAPGKATFTLVQFDHEYIVVCDRQPLAEAKPLDGQTYVPGGTTALLDAIGRTINDLGGQIASMPEADRPSRVLFTIITDGYENASHEYTRSRIFEMITHQREKYAWEFMFLAANQDAIASGGEIGIHAAYAASFRASPIASRKMFRMAAEKQAFSRSTGEPSVPFQTDERADLMSDEPADSAPKSPVIRPPRSHPSKGPSRPRTPQQT